MSLVVLMCARGRVVSCFYNALLVMVLFSFWLMLHVSNFNGKYSGQHENGSEEPENATLSNALIRSMVPIKLHKYLTSPVKNATAYDISVNNSSSSEKLTITEIKARLAEYNKLHTIYNEHIYGPLQNDSLVIVIQVHTRLMYLRHMVISLAQAQGINKVLLVFSHDYYDEEINTLVQSIDFCKVMQIFYPYSIQTHPDTFPGESPNDCPRNTNFKDAVKLNCANALHPDLYGHYREAKFTQTKHHWWWKANKVFNGLEITKDYTGLVLFLEEDHYVAHDFIYMLKHMQISQKSTCAFCKIFSLGTYTKVVNFASDYNKAEITPWISSKHNMGMAFDRSVWEELIACADTFCKYDDYNWDWSLQVVSNTCLAHELTALMLRTPRVYHIGECGVHHKNSCKSTAAIRKVQKLLLLSSRYLFPKELKLVYSLVKKKPLRKGNGGWGDLRDVELCFNMTIPIS